MQVGIAVGTETEVEGLMLGEEEVVEVLAVVVVEREVEREIGVLVLAAAPGVRYQFAGASPRHSPAVTPFQPFAWMRPK